MKRKHKNLYEKICSFENLHCAYLKARKGKRYKDEILRFGADQETLLLQLQEELSNETYRHGEYKEFIVCDSKKRHIKAAPFRDRIVHHAFCNIVDPIFDKGFIFDSYACRKGKGTHGAVARLKKFLRSAYDSEEGNIMGGYVLKCDVSKYFDNVDHRVLLSLIGKKISDEKTMRLASMIIESTCTKEGKGIPIGNLTSQFFANLYLNELDQFVKHTLKRQHYIRYMDDFIILGNDKRELSQMETQIGDFLQKKLLLALHPKKTVIHPAWKGVDFLGYVLFEEHVRLRKSTVMRFEKRIKAYKKKCAKGLMFPEEITLSAKSWVAYAKHARSWMLRKRVGEKLGVCFIIMNK
jgi:retron-type reverse transcriptase